MGGSSTSDWTSSGTSGPSSSPFTSRIQPQKIRGKMPCHARTSSSSENASLAPTMVSSEAMDVVSGTPTTMMDETVKKVVSQIALPIDYEWVLPLPSDPSVQPAWDRPSQFLPNSYRLVVGFILCAQLYGFNPSVEDFLGVLAPKLITGECFFYLTPRPGLTFTREKPSSHGAWKARFFFTRTEWGSFCDLGLVPKRLAPLNLGEIKRRMKEAGLIDHEFKAKAIMEEELLIVAGLHPAPDKFEAPLDYFTRLCKSLPSASSYFL
ncbi:hypothetical protein Salat_1634900 [Sesamum alatum]|uniref:Uncharacterized protein n=1 Tax=Sesamum alatum TaxID=300844 RepID=A0AAE2CJG0_9LAMI|nr:hypothetical protein Salat_1634900 [Sesamum alatum]